MSSTPIARVLGPGPSGVFVMNAEVAPARVASLARLKNLRVFEADCSAARNKRRLMEVLADALALPGYFGANWDALADCLTDLEWVQAEGYVLVLRGLEGLARNAPRDYEMLLDVLTDATAFWQDDGVPFYVLLAGDASTLGSDLPVISG
jgi:RNAse (barnase) inhibitor barstar